ncbi:MAG: acyl carrier protein [Acidobacteriota bacterium]
MQSRDILERLGGVIAESAAEEVDWSSVTADTTVEAFGFDSLSVLDLIFDLDQEFGTEIEAAELLKMVTLGDLINYLERNLPA